MKGKRKIERNTGIDKLTRWPWTSRYIVSKNDNQVDRQDSHRQAGTQTHTMTTK